MQPDDDAPITPTSRRGFDHEFDDDHHHQLQRRSVLTKVKDKAKRWRQRLAKKKQSRSGGDPTPAWGVSLDEEDDDEWDEQEYRGAPMYQSEMAPNAYRTPTPTSPMTPTTPQQGARQSTTTTDEGRESGWNPFDDDAADIINEKPALSTGDMPPAEAPPIERSSSISRLAGAVSAVIMAPAYMVSGATQMIVSKIQGSPGAAATDETGAKEAWDDDNGVSVKDYLKDKLEPGDGEKALSEVITEAISPRKAAQRQFEAVNVVEERVPPPSGVTTTTTDQATGCQGDERGVVEKVRGAVFSLIWRKEQIPVPVDNLPAPSKSSVITR